MQLLAEIEIEESNINSYQDVTTTAIQFDTKEEKCSQEINAKLIEKLKICEEELKQEKEKFTIMIETFKTEKQTLQANATLYREAFNYMTYLLRYIPKDMPYHGVENYTRYASALLGMLPLANVEQLKPEYGPVINDVLSFHYYTNIPPCHEVTANRSIFIAVISAPDNFEKRNLIRQTWRKNLNSNHDGVMGLSGFAFSLGMTQNNMTQSKIDQESKMYGDIIQSDVLDSYKNLTLKLVGLFNWLYRNCAKADFVFKVDDDVYVNVRNLVQLVQTYNPYNQSMCGTASDNFHPARGNYLKFRCLKLIMQKTQ